MKTISLSPELVLETTNLNPINHSNIGGLWHLVFQSIKWCGSTSRGVGGWMGWLVGWLVGRSKVIGHHWSPALRTTFTVHVFHYTYWHQSFLQNTDSGFWFQYFFCEAMIKENTIYIQ